MLVVARNNEDIGWIGGITGWQPLIVQKGVDLPNEGREGASFAYALAKLRPRLRPGDEVACVQGNPFSHCPDLQAALEAPAEGFQWVGDLGFRADAEGAPHHPGLPVGRCYQEWLGRPWPGGNLEFSAGGQFRVTGRVVRRHHASFYKRLQRLVIGEPEGPWVLERLWAEVFKEA